MGLSSPVPAGPKLAPKVVLRGPGLLAIASQEVVRMALNSLVSVGPVALAHKHAAVAHGRPVRDARQSRHLEEIAPLPVNPKPVPARTGTPGRVLVDRTKSGQPANVLAILPAHPDNPKHALVPMDAQAAACVMRAVHGEPVHARPKRLVWMVTPSPVDALAESKAHKHVSKQAIRLPGGLVATAKNPPNSAPNPVTASAASVPMVAQAGKPVEMTRSGGNVIVEKPAPSAMCAKMTAIVPVVFAVTTNASKDCLVRLNTSANVLVRLAKPKRANAPTTKPERLLVKPIIPGLHVPVPSAKQMQIVHPSPLRSFVIPPPKLVLSVPKATSATESFVHQRPRHVSNVSLTQIVQGRPRQPATLSITLANSLVEVP